MTEPDAFLKPDPAVMAEWRRRVVAYRAKSAWLRIPFYGGFALFFLGIVLLPAGALPWLAGALVLMLLFVGCFLSSYSFSSIRCPHCDGLPRSRSALLEITERIVCSNCGCLLAGDEAAPPPDRRKPMGLVERGIVQYAMGTLLLFDFFAIVSCAKAVPVVNGLAEGFAVPATWEAAVHEHGILRPWFLPAHHAAVAIAIIGFATAGMLASGRFLQLDDARRVGQTKRLIHHVIDAAGLIAALATFALMSSHTPTVPAP